MGNLPALQDDPHGVQPYTGGDNQRSMLEVVMRAAQDPNVDPGRLREFLQIGRELQKDKAIADFSAAFAALKPELPVIDKKGVVLNKSGRVQFKYARYDDLHRAITPLLTKHGFATSYDFEEPEKGRLTVILELSHRGGHSKFYRWTLPATGDNQYVTNLQNAAAARSFGKRCVLIDALDILTMDSDSDGRPVVPAQQITEEQANRLADIIAECENREPGKFTPRFKRWLKEEFKTDVLGELFQGAQYDAVMAKLREKMASLGVK